MGLAETANLAVRLTLDDQLTGGITKVNRQLSASQKSLGTLGKGARTFGSNLKSAFTTPLGLLGITGGLFGLQQIISSTIGKAQDFGKEVSRMMKITGLSAETTSALASAFEHYGISTDTAIKLTAMAEKNLGNLTRTTDLAGKFLKDYGFNLLTASGKVKDFNTLLLDSADFFNNKSIPAQKKAAALAKIYGRSWQNLIPILGAGRRAIQDAEQEAKDLGLTLTKDNLKQLADAREATRKWNTALGGLQLQIGLRLLPKLTDLAKTATSFVRDHGKEIIGFFDDAAKFAGDLGAAIHDDVLPVIGKIGDAWNAIPPDLKKLLIAGFAVNKLSGGAITSIAGNLMSGLGKGLIQGVLGLNAGVVNINAGVVNGGGGIPGVGLGGAAAGAAEGAGAAGAVGLGAAVLPVTIVAIGTAAEIALINAMAEQDRKSGAFNAPQFQRQFSLSAGAKFAGAMSSTPNTDKGIQAIAGATRDMDKAIPSAIQVMQIKLASEMAQYNQAMDAHDWQRAARLNSQIGSMKERLAAAQSAANRHLAAIQAKKSTLNVNVGGTKVVVSVSSVVKAQSQRRVVTANGSNLRSQVGAQIL